MALMKDSLKGGSSIVNPLSLMTLTAKMSLKGLAKIMPMMEKLNQLKSAKIRYEKLLRIVCHQPSPEAPSQAKTSLSKWSQNAQKPKMYRMERQNGIGMNGRRAKG
jgi:hypothetical protein